MAEEDVCGISGVEADAIERLGPTTRWHGVEFELPTEDARNSNPCEWQGAKQWRIPKSPVFEGYSWWDPKTDEVHVTLNKLGKHVFPSMAEADDFLRNKCGYEVVADRGQGHPNAINVTVYDGHWLGYDTPNAFARAPALFRAVAMALCRWKGNGIESSDMLRAYTQSIYEHQYSRWADFLMAHTGGDKWKEAAALLDAMPPDTLADTTAGRFLNSMAMVNINAFHNAAVLDDERVSGPRSPNDMRLSQIYDTVDQRRNALNNGQESPISRMLLQIRNFVNSHGIGMDKVIRYREALFTFERIEQVRANTEKKVELKKDEVTQKARRAFVQKRQADYAAQKRVFTEADERAAEEEFRRNHRDNHLPENFESIEINIRQNRRNDNPTQFEHIQEDGTKLEGADAANAYLNTLTDDERSILDIGNQIFSDTIAHVHDRAVQEGLFSQEDIENITRYGKNYIPQRSGDYISQIVPAYDPKGRYTPIENPYRNMAQYIQTVNRIANENMVRRSIVDNLMSFQSSTIWHLEDIHADSPHQNEGYVVSFPAGKDGPRIRKRLVVEERAMKTTEGKALAKLLEKDMKRNYLLQHMAGYTKFSSIMYTSAQPAWALKTFCINTFMTPIALQSALGLKNSEWREATQYVMPLMKHAMHDMRTRFRRGIGKGVDDIHAAWQDLAAEYGATSSHDPRYSTRNLMTDVRRAEGTVLDRLRGTEGDGVFGHAKSAAQTVGDEVTSKFQKYQGFNHAPDEIYKAATFRVALERQAKIAGRTLDTAEDLREFAKSNPRAVQEAVLASQRIMPQFHHKGNWAFLNSAFPFFNASLQTLPFMSQLISTRFGQFGLAGMAALGLMGGWMAHEEFGDDAENMKGGSNSGFYVGHGVYLPQDYAFGPALQIGKSLANGFFSSKPDYTKQAFDVAKSFFDSFSPFGTPWENQSWGSWIATHAVPPSVGAPFLALMGFDQNGQPLANENPADENGQAIANPAGYEYGKPSNSYFATQLAKGISSIDDQLKLSPGAVSAGFGILAPGMENTISNFLGERGAKMGDEDSGSVLSRFMNTFAPSFTTAPAYVGGRHDMEALVQRTIPSDGHSMQDYQNGLVGTERQQRVAQVAAEAKQAAAQITIDTHGDGELTAAQIKHELEAAKRSGDIDKVRRYKMLTWSIQHLQNECWKDHLREVDDGY